MARAEAQDFRQGRTVSCSTCGHVWWAVAKDPSCSKCSKAKRNPYKAALRAEREGAQASERAQRAAATRARNERDRARKRAAAGVCPCCHRSFKQLRRHMASQHPDFDPEAEQ